MRRTCAWAWLVLLPLVSARAQEPAADVHADLAAIVSTIELDRGAGLAYVGSLSAVNFIRGHAVIYTVACEDFPAWGGVFFTWSEIDGRATGELMVGPGPEGVRVLTGAELSEYLARVQFDPAPLRALFQRHYRERPPRPPPGDR